MNFKLFKISREDAHIKIVLLGLTIRFKNPLINQLGDCCCIPNLDRLLENGCKFPHPIGIVIVKGVSIGKNCRIFQNVTIGSKNGKIPTIGNNVCIYPNSVIFGDITIGDNAIIGAGAVVLKDVPANAIVAGNPAKIIN